MHDFIKTGGRRNLGRASNDNKDIKSMPIDDAITIKMTHLEGTYKKLKTMFFMKLCTLRLFINFTASSASVH